MSKAVLLDSHVFLWTLQEPHKIGARSGKRLASAAERYVSLATIWELGIKHHNGKLAFSPADLLSAVEDAGMRLLGIDSGHIVGAAALDIAHRDPFDRLLLVQAETEGLVFLTADAVLLGLNLGYTVNVRT